MIEKYFKWYNKSLNVGGTIRLVLRNNEYFSFQKVSGASIYTEALVELLWNSAYLADFRSAVTSLGYKRSGNWSLGTREGRSGCTDWYIRYLNKEGIVRKTDDILHSSMNAKQNIDINGIWIVDLYDCLWAMKEDGYFPSSFVNDDDTEYEYHDITESIVNTRDEFLKSSYLPYKGFYEHVINNNVNVDDKESKIYE